MARQARQYADFPSGMADWGVCLSLYRTNVPMVFHAKRFFPWAVAAAALAIPRCGQPAHAADSIYNKVVLVRENRQRSFRSTVPAGNYSGIAHVGGRRYAVVSDKASPDGFFTFDVQVDTLSGKLRGVANQGFVSSQIPNRDQEGVAYVPRKGTLFICGEADNRVLEFGLDGKPTGNELEVPDALRGAKGNYGLESLAYDEEAHCFWSIPESTLPCDGEAATYANGVANRLRLMCFNDSMELAGQFFYEMDKPTARKKPRLYAFGVSEVCPVGGGRLLVMEREFFVSRRKLGSWVNIKIYVVCPTDTLKGKTLPKYLLTEFKTRLNLFRYNLANYEGMCLGPRLADGNRVVILVSDSQNRYGGVLKDYFKTIVISDGSDSVRQ